VKRTDHRLYQVAFGAAVRDFRLAKQLSQEQLAAQIGTHRNYVGDIERAEETISLRNMLRFCDALDISLGELVRATECRLPRQKR